MGDPRVKISCFLIQYLSFMGFLSGKPNPIFLTSILLKLIIFSTSRTGRCIICVNGCNQITVDAHVGAFRTRIHKSSGRTCSCRITASDQSRHSPSFPTATSTVPSLPLPEQIWSWSLSYLKNFSNTNWILWSIRNYCYFFPSVLLIFWSCYKKRGVLIFYL